MATFQQRLNYAMRESGIRQIDLCERTGIAKPRISQYVNGLFEPKHETAEKLAKALHVSEGWLMGYDVPKEPMEARFNELMQESDEIIKGGKRVPLLGDIACGSPICAEQNIEEYVMCTDADADFAIRARGDSMVGKRIFDGDVVFIKQTPDVDNGEIAAVLIGTEATLKIVNKDEQNGVLMLMPANDKYQPLVYVGDQIKDVKILGKAISFQGVIK